MPSVNDLLLDATVRHQVYLQRYSTATVNKIIALLNRTDADLVAQILKRDPTATTGTWSRKRLDVLLTEVRKINRDLYAQVERATRREMRALASYEAGFQQRLLSSTIPVTLDIVTPAAEQLASAVLSRPFQGRLLSEWVSGLEAGTFARLRDQLRIGYVEGESIDTMVRRIRGTRINQYKDGVLEISRRGAQAMVRTAINHTANTAKEELFKANEDVIKSVRWVSTLDGRTSQICIGLDGKVFPVKQGRRPPAHINCRSTTVPVTKSFRELGVDADEVAPGTRASMDGQVPDDVTYGDWLGKQSAGFQDDVLGVTKGRLFRRGGLDVRAFVDRNTGQVWNLQELARREAEAFAKAGLAA